MKNIEVLKQKWIKIIEEMDSNAIYDVLTNGTIEDFSLCSICEKSFGVCEDTLKDDTICKQRFDEWCKMKATLN